MYMVGSKSYQGARLTQLQLVISSPTRCPRLPWSANSPFAARSKPTILWSFDEVLEPRVPLRPLQMLSPTITFPLFSVFLAHRKHHLIWVRDPSPVIGSSQDTTVLAFGCVSYALPFPVVWALSVVCTSWSGRGPCSLPSICMTGRHYIACDCMVNAFDRVCESLA